MSSVSPAWAVSSPKAHRHRMPRPSPYHRSGTGSRPGAASMPGRSWSGATFAARPELARLYGLAAGTELGFALIQHTKDGEPVQVEERYVNLGAVRSFGDADLAATLPDDLLARAVADGRTRLTVEAQPANGSIAWLLGARAPRSLPAGRQTARGERSGRVGRAPVPPRRISPRRFGLSPSVSGRRACRA